MLLKLLKSEDFENKAGTSNSLITQEEEEEVTLGFLLV